MNESVSNSDTAVRHDIVTRRGDTFHRRITFNQVVDGVSNPEDLTGCTFTLNIINRKDAYKTPVISFADGEISLLGSGIIEFGKTAVQMQVCPGIYWYDLQQVYPDGSIRTRLSGDFQINNDVTP